MELVAELLASLAELLDSLTDQVTDSPWTYLVILGLAAFDAILPVLPAEGVVLVAAALAGSGRLDIVMVTLAAGLGAFLGDNLAYWIGRTAGRPIVTRLMRGQPERLDWLAAQFHERGGSLIIVGRFVPGGRTVVAVGSGVLHFPWLKFLAYDAAAACIWALQAVIPGYLGGMLFADRPWIGMLIGFGMAFLIAAGIELLRRSRRGRAAAADGDPADPADVDPADVDPTARGTSGALTSGTDAPGVGLDAAPTRAHGLGREDEPDTGPGTHGSPEQAELADPQEVPQPGAESLAGEGPGAGRREEGQDVPTGTATDEEVGGRVEGADEQGQDRSGVQDQLEQAVEHRPGGLLRRP